MVAAVAASAAGNNQIVAAVANKKVSVRRYVLSQGVATAQNVKWRTASTDLTGLLYGPLSVGRLMEDGADDGFLFSTNPGEALNLNLSAATAVGGYVVYELEG